MLSLLPEVYSLIYALCSDYLLELVWWLITTTASCFLPCLRLGSGETVLESLRVRAVTTFS